MKVALYGDKIEILPSEREALEQSFGEKDDIVEIDFFSDKSNIRKNLFHYDIIILSKNLTKEMIMYVKEQRKQTITLTAGKQIETFELDEILYIEAELKTIHVVTREGEKIIRFPISEVEKLLDEDIFIKAHRSYIVNKKEIKSLLEKEVVLKNGKRIPVSKYRWKEVRRRFLGEI